MAYEVVDFLDIIDAIREDLKVQSGDTSTINKIKRVVNRVYLQEVIPFARWKWLEGSTRVIHKAKYNSGTCAATPNSATITLSTAPPAAQGSFAGKRFAVDGYNEIYIVESHVAESTTLTLSSNYTGNAVTTASFKIWTDTVALPTDCRETINVWHNFSTKPMEGIGLQKYRQITALNPRAESYPAFYYTGDFYDPTPLTDELETDRYRQMYIHPSINRTDCTLQIDYVKEISPLVDDSDEPILPLEDRSVLVDGALARLWKSIASDNENAELSKRDYESKLARMAGKIEDSQDTAKVTPTSTYVRSMRAPKLRPGSFSDSGTSGGGGYNAITYLEDVTIKGGNITGNITVAAGITIDGVDISEIGADITDHIADTTDAHAASAITNTPAGSISSTTVQTAINELDGDITSHVAGTSDSHAASAITNTPAGDIAATTVQAAIDELDSEKIAKVSSTDEAIVRFNSTAGAVQDSNVTIDDSGNITQATNIVLGVLASATLNDNTASPTAVFSLATASYDSCVVEYSIKRGSGNREIGHIYMINDGTTSEFTAAGAALGSSGVTFTSDISGGNMRLLYTTTSTGAAATMKYRIIKWVN